MLVYEFNKMHRFFKKVSFSLENKSYSQSTSTPPLIKKVVTTDKNSQHGKATNRQRQALNRFSAIKNPDRIEQLENHPPKGNRRRFGSMDIRATEIIQTWKQVSIGKRISICHF